MSPDPVLIFSLCFLTLPSTLPDPKNGQPVVENIEQSSQQSTCAGEGLSKIQMHVIVQMVLCQILARNVLFKNTVMATLVAQLNTVWL